MNNLKDAFGVSSRNVLGFTMPRKVIDLSLAKAKPVQDMEPLLTYSS